MGADNYRDCPKCGKSHAREDYEIYSENNEVLIYYSINCKICGYKYKIEENRPFLGLEEKCLK